MHEDIPLRTKRARKLRKKSTFEERLLWSKLKDRKLLGYKFRRQEPIGPYIVDFYCHEKLLVIELDGGQHNNKIVSIYDQLRTEYLESFGLKVIRFWNQQLRKSSFQVIDQIIELGDL